MANHFELNSSSHIDSINMGIEHYTHKPTGANHYHFSTDDDNQVFMVAFRTLPYDSTGIAHILEHTVLCGSEKYPVRDPFFLMLRRSLSNFMNAFTAADWTAYPFATQNQQDFDNLLGVYLDAVFFPKLDEMDFMQEGWRLDVQNHKPEEQADSDLVYKGVVFNEMKGAMSSPARQLWHHLCHHLFTTSTYHYNSGGDPLEITQLTHQQLVDFHQLYYHPSNATFFTYGNQPATTYQIKIQEQALYRFPQSIEVPKITAEPRRNQNLSVTEYYPVEKDVQQQDNKTHIVIGWLLDYDYTVEGVLLANLLNLLLLDNSASPMQYVLENTNLGAAPSPLCGVEDDMNEMVLALGLEGCQAEAQAEVEQLILNELQRLSEEGFDSEQINSCMHQLEISQREIVSGGFPYGLHLMLSTVQAAVHDKPVMPFVDLDGELKKLRERCQQPQFIKQQIKQLLANAHRVTLVMQPDPTMNERVNQLEKEQLVDWQQRLSSKQRQQIIDKNQQLEQRQLEQPNSDLLPTLSIEDIDLQASMTQPQYTDNKISGYATRCNGLAHLQLTYDLPSLSSDEWQLIPWLASFLTELGHGQKSYLQAQQDIAQYTGGVSCSSSLWQPLKDCEQDSFLSQLTIRSKGLVENSQPMIQLVTDMFSQPRFDELSHMQELLTQWTIHSVHSIPSSGHLHAMQAASSTLSQRAYAQFNWSGLVATQRLIQLSESLKDDSNNQKLQKFAESLASLHQKLNPIHASDQLLIADEQHLSHLIEQWQQQAQSIDAINGQPSATTSATSFGETLSAQQNSLRNISQSSQQNDQQSNQTAWQADVQVNYCARAYSAVAVTHQDSAAFMVLSHLLRNTYLHTAIREQGGAYGGGASYDSATATFRFFSYRDPRLLETFADFQQSLEQTLTKPIDKQSLQEAILSVCARLKTPVIGATEATQDFMATRQGVSAEFKSNYRKQVVNVSTQDLNRVIEQYLINQPFSDAVITNSKNAQSLQQQHNFAIEQIQL